MKPGREENLRKSTYTQTHTKKKKSVSEDSLSLSLSEAEVGLSHVRVSRKTLAEMQHYFLSEPTISHEWGNWFLTGLFCSGDPNRFAAFSGPYSVHVIM